MTHTPKPITRNAIHVDAINGTIALSDGTNTIGINADSGVTVANAIAVKSIEAKMQIVKMCDDLRACGWRWYVTDEDRKFGHWYHERGTVMPDDIYSEGTRTLHRIIFTQHKITQEVIQ